MKAKVETAIWLALKLRVESLPLDYAKAWPSQVFAVPHGGVPPMPLPYLRIGRISVAPVRRLIAAGKPHERTGSLMITLVYPVGQEVHVYDQLAGTIANYFKDGTQMNHEGVCVTVASYPHVQEGYEDNGYWTVPVRIPWRCFA